MSLKRRRLEHQPDSDAVVPFNFDQMPYTSYSRPAGPQRYRRQKTMGKRPSYNARRYGKARIYRSPSSLVYPFERTVSIPFEMSTTAGFIQAGGSDKNIAFSFSLLETNVRYSTSGVYDSQLNPGTNDFPDLFDFYRINRVSMKIIYSKNAAVVRDTVQQAPVLFIVNDYDDDAGFTGQDIMQYPSCRTIQLGQVNNAGPLHNLPFPGTVGFIQEDTGVGVAGSSKRSPWCDTNQNAIKHYGIKVSYNAMGEDQTVSLGRVLFVFTYFLDFKKVK